MRTLFILVIVLVIVYEVNCFPSCFDSFNGKRRLQSPNAGDISFEINIENIRTLLDINEKQQVSPPQGLSFTLPEGERFDCTFVNSEFFQFNQSLLPSLLFKKGNCSDHRIIYLNMDMNSIDSFSATFTIPNSYDWYYVDNIQHNMNKYVINRKTHLPEESTSFRCGQQEEGLAEIPHTIGQSFSSKTVIGKLRMAVVANREYSQFFSDSTALVLNSIAKLFFRVNGIFLRELGIYFEIISETSNLLCTTTSSLTGCNLLPNYNLNQVLDNSRIFIENIRNVSFQSYDIAHILTTNSIGVASVNSFCTENKARGTTGRFNPIGDGFYVDYVSHEIGHQLGGNHVFKNCDSNAVHVSTAVEPGSGSTIMSYAGVCGRTDIQSNSDPYFNSVNLEEMKTQIIAKLGVDGCGSRLELTSTSPVILIPKLGQTCNVPVGNYFQLKGEVNQPQMYFFQWEQTTPKGAESYLDMTIPRFRSVIPTPYTKRFFPNLYALTHGLQNSQPFQLHENIPQAEMSMTFRFIVRNIFSLNAEMDEFDPFFAGDFSTKDLDVSFTSKDSPLRWKQSTRNLFASGSLLAGQKYKFEWTGGNKTSSRVKILLAINTMVEMVENFQYGDVKDLEWIELADVPNNESSLITIPFFTQTFTQVNFMIRTFNDDCFAFDYFPKCQIKGIPLTANPTNFGETRSPTRFPVLSPTASPTKCTTGVNVQIGKISSWSSSSLYSTAGTFNRFSTICAPTSSLNGDFTFSFSVTNAGNFTIETLPGVGDTILSIFRCFDSTALACNDDISLNSYYSRLVVYLNPETLYIASVSSYAESPPTTFRLKIVPNFVISLTPSFSPSISSAVPSKHPSLAKPSKSPSILNSPTISPSSLFQMPSDPLKPSRSPTSVPSSGSWFESQTPSVNPTDYSSAFPSLAPSVVFEQPLPSSSPISIGSSDDVTKNPTKSPAVRLRVSRRRRHRRRRRKRKQITG